jgi:hypothetical protein
MSEVGSSVGVDHGVVDVVATSGSAELDAGTALRPSAWVLDAAFEHDDERDVERVATASSTSEATSLRPRSTSER